jgi:Uma2 family endonuclease
MSSAPTAAAASVEPQLPLRLTMEEYLHTMYHPDCDFVDGVLEERNVGELEHGTLQAEIAAWFVNHRAEWNIRITTEWRNRVSPTRVRIPDICVISRSAPREQVGQTPPLLCIEIRSPEDRLSRILTVFEDYRQMGVANLWLIDPVERTAMVYTAGGLKLHESTRLTIADSPIYLDLPEIFAALD